MKSEQRDEARALYQSLRRESWETLWKREVPRFDAAEARERLDRVAVIRAVGVVFSESGPTEEKPHVLLWLRGLLNDPSEKIRRYAMAALPKIGADAEDELRLISQLDSAENDREKKYVQKALGKIGGTATLQEVAAGEFEQKIKASLTRLENPSAIRFESVLENFNGMRISLRGRRGLERIVADEAKTDRKFRVLEIKPGCVTIIPSSPFSIAEIYSLRCFGHVGFSLGLAKGENERASLNSVAELLTSPFALRILRAFTEGAIRYRINFAGKGHQRAAVAELARAVYARCPEILNDPQRVTWTLDIFPANGGQHIELHPNITPDPRFSYRQQDVPAASHPPLAAALAFVAGRAPNEVVWDPFCGSGLELAESALRGGVKTIFGSDLSPEAVEITRANFLAAKTGVEHFDFLPSDFREASLIERMKASGVTLIITNPPMGMRVPVADLQRMIEDLYRVSAQVLKPGGRLVLVNPSAKAVIPKALKLEFEQKVDMGGFECRIQRMARSNIDYGHTAR